ncbi:MAG: hypothetical protein MUF07_04545 [Steroidobacteraceae bacterium]|jgi:hypothetical protein|nr:hypothetical protein [Steroidobacteraceae bacterium]
MNLPAAARRATRGLALLTVLALGSAAALPQAPAADPSMPPEGGTRAAPRLTRIRIATVAAPDLRQFEQRYARWFGYVVRERGRVDPELAAGWGAPRAAGRPYVLMSAAGWPDVYLRAVRAPPVRGYRPLATHGWNAIELIVDDPRALRDRMRRSPFTVIGEPEPLRAYPSIVAFQVRGAAGEVVYLTSETGDRSRSILPPPRGEIGRPFIMVLAGPDIHALLDFYATSFGLAPGPVRARPLQLLEAAQGYEPGRALPIATARLAQHGNLIEFDGYSERATARPARAGELPPGVAMTSFGVADLDALRVDYLRPPRPQSGLAYGGRRTATVIGPAGERIELIEE